MPLDLDRKDLSARCGELRAQYEWARGRHAELVEMQSSIVRRRAEVRAGRERLQSEVVARLSDRRARCRAAAAFLEAAMHATDVPMMELWIDYFALGGSSTPDDLAAMIEGRAPLDSYTHDVVAVALNERLQSMGFGPFVSYWDGAGPH
jgi:hypothetical protein